MKLSLEWLNAYLDSPVTADDVERLLTSQGFPIESREEAAAGDVVIDAEITSNRSDCLSQVGLAREVAAGSGRQLVPADCTLPAESGDPVAKLTSVANEALEDCPVYTARVIRGVKIGPSPDWLRRRLEAIGLRSINNVVDVTNYILMEMGQPLHAFDMAKLQGRRIVVRHARKGEAFVAIDGSKHTLSESMLVIADAQRPVAIAGVMGGLDSEVTEKTTDVLLESARFRPLSVRRTSRALKLASDSSYRFERGVDPAGIELASRRAAKLIVELAGGTLAPGVIRVGESEPTPRRVSMRVARCQAILGVTIEPAKMVNLLQRLGLSPQLDRDGATITCTIPTYRLDLEREIDLIEEVGRMAGLDAIPVQEKIHIVARSKQPAVAARQELGRVLTAQGYLEAVTFSFVAPRHGQPFVPSSAQAVMIDDERRKAEPMLRPSLAPSLLICRKFNQDMANADVRLYETAATWLRVEGRIVERQKLAMLADAHDAEQAFRLMRGAVDELAAQLGGPALDAAPVNVPWASASLRLSRGGQDVGVIALISPATQQLFDLQTPVVVGEFDLQALLEHYPPRRQVQPMARFPAVERDLSIVVNAATAWAAVESAVRAAEPRMLEALRFVGVYKGKPIPPGRKSVTFRMLFRDPAGTLRSEQVDAQVEAVVARLKKDLGAELRA